ncbi:hypothetical protein P0F65_22220 [Sphingomonas sp. I4]
MIAPGTEPEVIATGIRWAEGPVWVPRGEYLLFSDPLPIWCAAGSGDAGFPSC